MVVLAVWHKGQKMNANAFIVQRKLTLITPLSKELETALYEQGILKLKQCGNQLILTYDASQLSLTSILSAVEMPLTDSLWQRALRKLYAFKDQNIADGARHEPHCCNKIQTPRRE